MTYHFENTKIQKIQTNVKEKDIPQMFVAIADKTKTRANGEFSKMRDNNYHNLALRK